MPCPLCDDTGWRPLGGDEERLHFVADERGADLGEETEDGAGRRLGRHEDPAVDAGETEGEGLASEGPGIEIGRASCRERV